MLRSVQKHHPQHTKTLPRFPAENPPLFFSFAACEAGAQTIPGMAVVPEDEPTEAPPEEVAEAFAV